MDLDCQEVWLVLASSRFLSLIKLMRGLCTGEEVARARQARLAPSVSMAALTEEEGGLQAGIWHMAGVQLALDR